MPEQQLDSYELAQANRKLVTVVMGMTLLMGLVACLAYLAGRSVTAMKAQTTPNAPIVVEAPAAQPKVITEVVQAPPPGKPVEVGRAPAAAPREEMFLQAGAGTAASLAPLEARLKATGYPVRVVEIEGRARLLVGPAADAAALAALRARLTADGHPHFFRRLALP